MAGLFIAKAYRGLLRLVQETDDQLSLGVYVKIHVAMNFYQARGFKIRKSDGNKAKMTWQAQKD